MISFVTHVATHDAVMHGVVHFVGHWQEFGNILLLLEIKKDPASANIEKKKTKFQKLDHFKNNQKKVSLQNAGKS